MPDFQYTARDIDGQQVTGTLAAGTQREAISQLTGRSLFPVRVVATDTGQQRRFRKRVSGQLLATLYSQLSSLLRSGVPLLRSLTILKEQTSHQGLAAVLEDVHAGVEDGATLGSAMGRHEAVFRQIAVNMVHAGEEGGFLEDALDRIAQFTEEQEDLKSRTVGALAYPIFLSVFGTAVVIFLLVFLVPQFDEVFADMRSQNQLPLLTDMLLGTSAMLKRWGILIVVVLVVGFVLIQRHLRTERGRRRVDRAKLKLPGIGPILTNLAVARFCRVLGTLLQNGVPILRSLEISRFATGNLVISDIVEQAGENVSTGDSLTTPLARNPEFPREIVEMISVAEESNTLDTVLIDIADRLERRTSRRLDLFVRLLEPLLLLILALIVMLVVMALLLPIMNMSSTL